MAPDLLSARALNRATLHRQGLLERGGGIADTIEHLVGLQAQNPLDPYIALASRLDHFAPDQLGQLLIDRVMVRAALMRGTLHLVTRGDYNTLRPTFAPVLERVFNSTAYAKDIAGMNRPELLVAAGELLAKEPMTRAELGRQLETRWPDARGASMAHAATYLLSVVQPTPRGVWGKKSAVRWTTAQSWLGEQDWKPELPEQVIYRYLAAFGPASMADIRTWSGLAGLRPIMDRMRHSLRVWKSEDGTDLFDLVDAVHPDRDTPAPPRFLPEYDNVLLGHADRSRFFPDQTAAPGWRGNLLVDGYFAGSWQTNESKTVTRVVIAPQVKLTKKQRTDIETEAHRLLPTLYADALDITVEIPSP